jgi:hypothetical protein
MASLSVEEAGPDEQLVVALFDVPMSAEAVAAWIDREHEYKFVAVQAYRLDGAPEERMAVRTRLMLRMHRWSCACYRRQRCLLLYVKLRTDAMRRHHASIVAHVWCGACPERARAVA